MAQYGYLMKDTRNSIAKKLANSPQPIIEEDKMSEEVDIGLSADSGPKNWAGGGGYSYELIAPGKIRVTGSDTSKTLQGGQSAVVTDPSVVRHIMSERDSGDPAVGKETPIYNKSELKGMMQKDPEDRALYNQSELKGMMQRDPEDRALYSQSELKDMMQRESNLSESEDRKEAMLQSVKQRLANISGPEAVKQMEEYKPSEEPNLGESEMMPGEGGAQSPLDRVQSNIREAMDEAMSMGDKAGFQKLSSMLAGMMGK